MNPLYFYRNHCFSHNLNDNLDKITPTYANYLDYKVAYLLGFSTIVGHPKTVLYNLSIKVFSSKSTLRGNNRFGFNTFSLVLGINNNSQNQFDSIHKNWFDFDFLKFF